MQISDDLSTNVQTAKDKLSFAFDAIRDHVGDDALTIACFELLTEHFGELVDIGLDRDHKEQFMRESLEEAFNRTMEAA